MAALGWGCSPTPALAAGQHMEIKLLEVHPNPEQVAIVTADWHLAGWQEPAELIA